MNMSKKGTLFTASLFKTAGGVVLCAALCGIAIQPGSVSAETAYFDTTVSTNIYSPPGMTPTNEPIQNRSIPQAVADSFWLDIPNRAPLLTNDAVMVLSTNGTMRTYISNRTDEIPLNEKYVFFRELRHDSSDPDKNWRLRVGKGGQIYSVLQNASVVTNSREYIGNQAGTQNRWQDRVIQTTVTPEETLQPYWTNTYTSGCMMHQSGSRLDGVLTNYTVPYFAPNLGYKFTQNDPAGGSSFNYVQLVFIMQNTGTLIGGGEALIPAQAHPKVLHWTYLRDVGNGAFERVAIIHNFGQLGLNGVTPMWTGFVSWKPAWRDPVQQAVAETNQMVPVPTDAVSGNWFTGGRAGVGSGSGSGFYGDSMGWMALVSAAVNGLPPTGTDMPDPGWTVNNSKPGIGFVYGTRELGFNNASASYGGNTSPQMDLTVFSTTHEDRIAPGETRYSKQYFVLDDFGGIQATAGTLAPYAGYGNLEPYSIDAPEHRAGTLSLNRYGSEVSYPHLRLWDRPIVNGTPIFTLYDKQTQSFLLTDDPYILSDRPQDGRTIFVRFNGFALKVSPGDHLTTNLVSLASQIPANSWKEGIHTNYTVYVMNDRINLPPVPVAAPKLVSLDPEGDGGTVNLNAEASYDTDGTIDNYRWYEGGVKLIEGASVNYTFGPGSHTLDLRVEDNDGSWSGLSGIEVCFVTQRVSVVTEDGVGTEPSDPVSFRISRAGSTSNALPVYYTMGGTAASGVDYPAPSGVVTIPSGQTSALVSFTPSADGYLELPPDKTVILSLVTNSAYGIDAAQSDATAVIYDVPGNYHALSIALDVQEPDGVEGGAKIRFRINRFKQDLSSAITMSYRFSGTATPGVDYPNAATGTYTIAAGSDRKYIDVNPTADSLLEGPESVILTIYPGSGFQVDQNKSTQQGTIAANQPLALTVTEPDGVEGGARIRFRISRFGEVLTNPITVSYVFSGTATPGLDYPNSATGSVTLAASSDQAFIDVYPLADQAAEGLETVIMTVGTNSALGTIGSADPTVYYALTVNSGNGDGLYTNGTQVAITADAPASGKAFSRWIGDTQVVASVTASNTTVTMPAQAVALTATYAAEVLYTLTITGGSGSGSSYTNTQVVAISANAPATGTTFDKWIGDTQYVNNVTYTNALVSMPTNAVSLSATYKNLPGHYTLTVNNGTGGGLYTNGTQVAISAVAPDGTAFEQWTGDTQVVAGVFSLRTIVTMPAQDTALTASCVDISNGVASVTWASGIIYYEPDYASLLGPTGSGKSTIAQLMYSPDDIKDGILPSGAGAVNDVVWDTITLTENGDGVIEWGVFSTSTVRAGTNGYVYALIFQDNHVQPGDLYVAGPLVALVDGAADVNVCADPGNGEAINGVNSAPVIGGVNASYTLTVNSGSGSGTYTNGQQVAIAASNAPSGKVFDKWTGSTQYVASVSSSSTTVTMPAQAISLTATYADIYYLLTANGATSGSISPASTNVIFGGSAGFVVTASNYYRIATLTTNGASAGVAFNNLSTTTNFIWSNVQTSGVLAATFTAQVTTNGPAQVPYSWLAQYGLTNYNTDAAADQDQDGLSAWQEYIAGTVPTNGTSCFKAAQTTRNVINWSAVSGRIYSVYWSTNLMKGFTNLNNNILYPQGSYTNATPDTRVNHYQLKVRMQ